MMVEVLIATFFAAGGIKIGKLKIARPSLRLPRMVLDDGFEATRTSITKSPGINMVESLEDISDHHNLRYRPITPSFSLPQDEVSIRHEALALHLVPSFSLEDPAPATCQNAIGEPSFRRPPTAFN